MAPQIVALAGLKVAGERRDRRESDGALGP
jgi:hypothetical protein